MGNEIKKAKPKKSDDSLKYPDYFDYIDIIAERKSIALELEDIVRARGGKPHRYTSYDEELLELAKELKED